MQNDIIKLYADQFPDPTDGPGDYPVCVGGDLTPERLLGAYSRGFFPWYNDDDPICWWSPDPRCVLFPDQFRLPTRSARYIAKQPFKISFNTAFDDVIEACARPRSEDSRTWLNNDMIKAYKILHQLGFAHSIETWKNGELIGGLYGIWLGNVFFGESMFHLVSEASRAALSALVNYLKRNGCKLIDCQQETPHMLKMGAGKIRRRDFLRLLNLATNQQDYAFTFEPRFEKLVYDPLLDVWAAKS